LVSAKDSPTAWDLRVFIREKMIEFIQKNYPESLPRTRVVFEQGEQKSTTDLLNKTKA
jgi:c-di-GMP-related signal transduction protein